MKFGERIKALRTEKPLTQKELGKYLGVSEVSVRCWENGTKNPSMNAIIALSNLFNVTTDYLLGVSVDENKDNSLLTQQETILLSNYRILDKHGKTAVDTICCIEKERVESNLLISKPPVKIISGAKSTPNRYIPRYTTSAAAGYSMPLGGDDFEMILVDDSIPSDADFAVGVEGNSMYPYIHDGDTVYVKKNCELSIGDIGIFCVDGAVYCKQYYIDQKHNLILVSANPKLKHTNLYISAESSEEVKCYGKVILDYKIDLPDYLFE